MLTLEELAKLFHVESHAQVPKYEVVNVRMKRSLPHHPEADDRLYRRQLPPHNGDVPSTLSYQARLSGRNLEMNLRRNHVLLRRDLRVVRSSTNDAKVFLPGEVRNCHYIGVNESVVAAFSECEDDGGLTGIMLLPEDVLEVRPVPARVRHMVYDPLVFDPVSDEVEMEEVPHVVYSAWHRDPYWDNNIPNDKPFTFWDDERQVPNLLRQGDRHRPPVRYPHPDRRSKPQQKRPQQPPRRYPHPDRWNFTSIEKRDPGIMDIFYPRGNARPKFLELAVFVDQAAYNLFMEYTGDEAKFTDLILGYINQVQAIYLQPSLKEKVHISLVHMELQEEQPSDLPHHEGNRDRLLSSFCKYQSAKNPRDDSDPAHWDAALYLSGLNFYGMEAGRKNSVTMGLAPVGGVCHRDHNCVITEFGGTTDTGKPYPSAGWTSTYVAAHEIGHNLGMLHDGPPNNDCPSNGFIMSPSRGTKGETTWSDCSSEVVRKMGETSCLSDKPSGVFETLRHDKFENLPGQEWDSHDQCKIFLRDEDATLYNASVIGDVCERVVCKTPNRMGYYKAGPALEGTFCGDQKWCRSGRCVDAEGKELVPEEGGWGEWQLGKCKSGCISSSKGSLRDHRSCDSPRPRNTAEYCEGEPFRIKLCDDTDLCSRRESAVSYAGRKCEEWKKVVKDLSSKGAQVKHNEGRKWQACAVYCKFTNGPWYTPRAELNDLGDAFFPDGTWCHNDGKRDYYCKNHVCQPEIQGRSLFFREVEGGADVPILGNAHPQDTETASDVKEFFTYDDKGSNTRSSLPEAKVPDEEEYTDNDYVSLPVD